MLQRNLTYFSVLYDVGSESGRKEINLMGKALWLLELLNYKMAPNVNTVKTCNDRCQPISLSVLE
jgi:hypothetical protein